MNFQWRWNANARAFDNGILIGEIVNVNADERILTDGKIDPKKLKPITYDPVNNTYIGLGEVAGESLWRWNAAEIKR
ncbi:MAG: hypothetical protein ACLR2E_02005 [Lachnospiraceae bacterium]